MSGISTPIPLQHVRNLIIGAGPTGLAAAQRLEEIGSGDWLLFDAQNGPGGLASTVRDEKGFLWDLGGHVIFSHYEDFDKTLDKLLTPDGFNSHIRVSHVWMKNSFIPYPLQNNIWRLPKDDICSCIDGLLQVHADRIARAQKPKNFEDWIQKNFGQGLSDLFMIPYNFKVWAHPPKLMDSQWMGERVATVDVGRVIRNVVLEKDDAGWGPNATFRFPKKGGTGGIWKALYESLPAEKFRFSSQLTQVDAKDHIAHFSDGSRVKYENMLSTVPMDQFISLTSDAPTEIKDLTSKFKHSASHIVGIGLDGQPPEHLKHRAWMYYPEDDCPFYRVTVFSNYAEENVPIPGKQWSLMCEISESEHRPAIGDGSKEAVIEATIQGLLATKLISSDDTILSTWHKRLEYGYPTPWLGRDEVVHTVDAELLKHNIWSRGRFGGWKYEVANQDHSFAQGAEAADCMEFGTEEMTFRYPNVVNAGKSKSKKVPFREAGSSSCQMPK